MDKSTSLLSPALDRLLKTGGGQPGDRGLHTAEWARKLTYTQTLFTPHKLYSHSHSHTCVHVHTHTHRRMYTHTHSCPTFLCSLLCVPASVPNPIPASGPLNQRLSSCVFCLLQINWIFFLLSSHNVCLGHGRQTSKDCKESLLCR